MGLRRASQASYSTDHGPHGARGLGRGRCPRMPAVPAALQLARPELVP